MQTIKAAACPSCGVFDSPILVRSERRGDTTSRKCVCPKCSTRFVRVIEYFDEQPGADCLSLDLTDEQVQALAEIRARRGLPISGNDDGAAL